MRMWLWCVFKFHTFPIGITSLVDRIEIKANRRTESGSLELICYFFSISFHLFPTECSRNYLVSQCQGSLAIWLKSPQLGSTHPLVYLFSRLWRLTSSSMSKHFKKFIPNLFKGVKYSKTATIRIYHTLTMYELTFQFQGIVDFQR